MKQNLKLKKMKIVIAPNLNEIVVKNNGHLFEVEYNGLRIEFVLNENNTLNENCWNTMKRYIQQAIALSSKSWYVKGRDGWAIVCPISSRDDAYEL